MGMEKRVRRLEEVIENDHSARQEEGGNPDIIELEEVADLVGVSMGRLLPKADNGGDKWWGEYELNV
ncbi:hypothetical protein KJ764_01440 [Patescibacteria group bacterium]|nr:hypothetical protein [Patescibacteria group bacterium]